MAKAIVLNFYEITVTPLLELSTFGENMPADIEFLGELLVRSFRNTAVSCVDGLCKEQFDSPNHREYQKMLRGLPAEQKELLQRVVLYCVEGALNDTLHSLDAEINKKRPRLQIFIDGESVTNGESPSKLGSRLWGADGWLSRYGEKSDVKD